MFTKNSQKISKITLLYLVIWIKNTFVNIVLISAVLLLDNNSLVQGDHCFVSIKKKVYKNVTRNQVQYPLLMFSVI